MYRLRGCEPCVSCMGLGLLKELKFSKVCLKNTVTFNKAARSKLLIFDCSSITIVYCGKIFRSKMPLKLRSCKFKYKDVTWTAHLVFFIHDF